MIPKNWKEVELGDGIILISGQHILANDYSEDSTQTPYITGPADFVGGKVLVSKFTSSPKAVCRKGDILITVKGSGTGTMIFADDSYCISRQLMAVRSKVWDAKFLFFAIYLNSGEYGKNAVGLIPGIARTDILKTRILLPPLAEQHKIADILSTWDRAIDLTEKLIAVKTRFKRGLMQQLMGGKKRFPEFQRQKWEKVELGEVTTESKLRNDGTFTASHLMAVTKVQGMLPMREQVQGQSVVRCKVVAKDWFAYNPMRLNIGSIAKWNGPGRVVVSPDYVVFRCSEDQLDAGFLNQFRRSHQWANFVQSTGDGSVRIRIYYSHLAELVLHLPPIEEQRRIALVLEVADREIEILTKKLEALKLQKKGLMQKLLTGEIRVKVDEPAHAEAAV